MKTGDRVLYVGTSRPDWHGIPATITSYSPLYTSVEFDRAWATDAWGLSVTGTRGTGINSSDLQPLVLDRHKPIVADGTLSKNEPYEVIGTITFVTDGRELLMVRTHDRGNIVHVDPATGRVVPKHEGDRCGAALTFRNAPAVTTNDVAIDEIIVRVTRTDGAVTAVEWVQ